MPQCVLFRQSLTFLEWAWCIGLSVLVREFDSFILWTASTQILERKASFEALGRSLRVCLSSGRWFNELLKLLSVSRGNYLIDTSVEEAEGKRYDYEHDPRSKYQIVHLSLLVWLWFGQFAILHSHIRTVQELIDLFNQVGDTQVSFLSLLLTVLVVLQSIVDCGLRWLGWVRGNWFRVAVVVHDVRV